MRFALHQLRARCVALFFANFFRLLVVAISVAQSVLVWWLFPAAVTALGVSAYLLAPIVMYSANRWLMRWTTECRLRGQRIGALPRLYYAAALTCLFCVAYLGLLTIVWAPVSVFLEALAVEARPIHLAASGSAMNPVFRFLGDAGVAGIALAFAYGYTIGQRRLRITRIELALRNFPPGLDGLRIAQISDIHIGENLSVHQLTTFVARVNALQPDIVCITGDIVDSPHTEVDELLGVLARLRASHGVFAILGNHDHYAGAERVEGKLRALTSFTVLRDAQTSLHIGGSRLHIIGLDDRGRDWARGVPAVAYLGSVLPTLPADEPVIVLCHRPDIFAQTAAVGVALTLSGHTHGGQLGVPWFNGRVRNLAEFVTAFDRGLFERDGSYLYVNCGLGVTGQRIRLCTPREITVIEARSQGRCARAA